MCVCEWGGDGSLFRWSKCQGLMSVKAKGCSFWKGLWSLAEADAITGSYKRFTELSDDARKHLSAVTVASRLNLINISTSVLSQHGRVSERGR